MNKKYLIIGGVVVVAVIVILYFSISANKLPSDQGVIPMPVVTSGENPRPGDVVHNLPVEPAAAEARKNLAEKLSVDEKSIVIMKVEEASWSDSCLGLGKAHESCLQAITPGFKVEMLAKGTTYYYRTDQTGMVTRDENE